MLNRGKNRSRTASSWQIFLLAILATFLCAFVATQSLAFTLNVIDGDTGLPINGGFRYLVEEDNTNHTVPGALTLDTISLDIHKSHAPVVTTGSSLDYSVDIALPDTMRYFVSVLPDHVSGAPQFALSGTPVPMGIGVGAVTVPVNMHPLPTSQITVFAHVDHNPINNTWDTDDGGLDFGGIKNGGLGGVTLQIADAGGQVTQDAFGNPLGTTYQKGPFGEFITDAEGNPVVDVAGTGTVTTLTLGEFTAGGASNPYGLQVGEAVIKFITPGKYGIVAIPPDNDDSGNVVEWVQTSTIEGTPVIDAWVKANEPTVFVEGFGTGFNHAAFGFVKTSPTGPSTINGQVVNVTPWNITDTLDPNYVDRATFTGSIEGTLRLNHFSRPPTLQGFFAGPEVEGCWVGLNDPIATPGVLPAGLYAAPCDPETGHFLIENVPPGTYQLVNWENPLDYLFGFRTVTVPPGTGGNGDAVTLGDVLVFRWFGNLEGSVFLDHNENGFRDPEDTGLASQDVVIRFRDGTVYQATVSDIFGDYSLSEVFPFFKWLVTEVGFPRLKDTGYTSVVDYGGEILTDAGWAMPSRGKLNPQPQADTNINTGNNLSRTEVSTEPGATLLQSMHLFLGQTNIIDYGKAPYGPGPDGNFGTTDDENGGISGIVFYAITRAEDDPRFAAGEPWEPGIPRVQINVYPLSADSNGDGVIDAPGLADVDNYPLGWADGTGAFGPEDIDRNGNGTFNLHAAIANTWTDSWDDDKPSGCIQDLPVIRGTPINECADNFGTWNQVRPGVFDGGYAINGLETGTYIVEAAVPPGYILMKEEDKNVDFGEPWTPSQLVLPPICVNYDDLGEGGNGHLVPAELSLFPGEPAPFAGTIRPFCDRKQVTVVGGRNAAAEFWAFTEVPKAARAVGFVNNDLGAEFNMGSPNFGEKLAPPFIPISLRDWKGVEFSRIYADEFGSYNALLPSTYTVNTASPTGVTPNMVNLVLNEPIMPDGSIDPYYDPTYTVTSWTLHFNPGATTYLDTPIIPNAAFSASDIKIDTQPADASPVVDAVSGPSNGGPLLCTDLSETTITLTSAGLTTFRNPAYSPGSGEPLTIQRDFGFGAQGLGSSVTLNGSDANITILTWDNDTITATVSGAMGGTLLVTRDNGATSQVGVNLNVEDCTATTVLNVSSGGSIQAAIDAAPAGALILVAPGTYNENVIMYKPVRLQGAGAGTIISANPNPIDRLQAWHARVDALGARDFATFLGQDPFSASETPGIFVIGELGYSATGTLNPGNLFSGHQPMVDGFKIIGSKAGGGIFAVAGVQGLLISNNEITGNSGTYAGGIAIGTPAVAPGFVSGNDNVVIRDNKLHRNAGIQGSGGLTMNDGSNNYLVENNLVHGNLGRFNGGGIGHLGLSLGENIIRGNQVLFNEAFFGALLNNAGDGGGIFVGDDGAGGSGTGNLTIDSNLIQGNMSGAGSGGGIRAFAVNAADVSSDPNNPNGWYHLKIFNNIIINNVAGLAGAGISLQDVARASIINNTIANNDSTATGAFAFEAGAADSTPQVSGIAAGEHSAILQSFSSLLQVVDYADPQLVNNIIWHNRSYFNDASLNGGAGGLAANPAGLYWDLGVTGVVGTPPALNPDYSILSGLTGPNLEDYDDGTNLAADPAFVLGYNNALESATVVDEGGNAINVRFTPLDQNAGDYHLTAFSAAIDSGISVAVPKDFDGDSRPQLVTFDVGADEVLSTVSDPPTAVSLAEGPGTVLGTYDFMAVASGGTGTYGYQFSLTAPGGSPVVVQALSTNGTWTWDPAGLPAGTYQISVAAQTPGSTTVSATLDHLIAVTLTEAAGTVLGTFDYTGGVSGGGTDTYRYLFRLKAPGVPWTTVQTISTNDTWNFDTAGLPGGLYRIYVVARIQGTNTLVGSATFNHLISLNPPTTVTLTESPGTVLGTFDFLGEASGGDPPYQYRFRLKAPGVPWVTVQDYPTNLDTWNWNPSGLPAGTYRIFVSARSRGNTTSVTTILDHIIP